MASHIRQAPGPYDVIVDLSNVCRSAAFGKSGAAAEWSRYQSLVAAWRAFAPAATRILAVADENLRFQFSPSDKAQFQRHVRNGDVRVAEGTADPLILNLAEKAGAAVLSGDNFRGHRRDHPWIQGNTDRFFEWTMENGQISIVPRDMGMMSPATISRHAERDDLKGRGIDPATRRDRQLLERLYRCPNATCLAAQFSPEHLLVPPEQRDARVVCPSCSTVLEDKGERPAAAEIVAELDGVVILRRVIANGQTATIGRGELTAALKSSQRKKLGGVSRDHLTVRVAGAQLIIRDAGSRNGTVLQRWSSSDGARVSEGRLGEGDAIALDASDAVLLANVVTVRRSGQRFAIAPDHELPHVESGSVTRMESEEDR